METFTNIPKWLKDLDLQDCNCTVKILFGNKNDLPERSVPRELAFKYADSNNMFLFETSAKTGDSVNEAFEHLVSRMLVVFHDGKETTSKPSFIETCILSEPGKVEEMIVETRCAC